MDVAGGFLEEFGEDGCINMEASASSQMEIPPAPDVACGMVRRARGEKGKQGRRGALAVAGDCPMPPLFPFLAQRVNHHSATNGVSGGTSCGERLAANGLRFFRGSPAANKDVVTQIA